MSTLKVDAIRHNSATSDAITTAADGTCTAKLTSIGGGQLSHRNLIINGALRIAQRGASSTVSGYGTVDMFRPFYSGTDEAPTQAQVSVDTGTTPFSLGLKTALKITNGNQTSGAGTADVIEFATKLEAQNLANSGWNYTSTSSFITLSFWVKSSVAQNFYGQLVTTDGTQQNYPFETGSLTADTWTKVTKTIPGNANLTFDNNTDKGIDIKWIMYRGTNTTGSVSLNAWAANNNSVRMPNNTSTWYTTNDATFEITGVQLEVGDTATSFEHRSYGDELARCQRYYQLLAPPVADSIICFGGYIVNEFVGVTHFIQEMRITPTLVVSNFTSAFRVYGDDGNVNPSTLTTDTGMNTNRAFFLRAATGGTDVGDAHLRILSANSGVYATIAVSAEL